jgi:hypothetical protein
MTDLYAAIESLMGDRVPSSVMPLVNIYICYICQTPHALAVHRRAPTERQCVRRDGEAHVDDRGVRTRCPRVDERRLQRIV